MMYWQEEDHDPERYVVPDNIVDLSFKVSCRALPLDHAHALSRALQDALPWLVQEPRAGIHLIHGAESGNGWIRPQGPDDVLYLSRRTRLTLRLPVGQVAAARGIEGHTLDIGGHTLTLGATCVRRLSALTTLFARHVVADQGDDEAAFLERAAQLLGERGIRVKKMMSGRCHIIRLPQATLVTRSLMIDGLQVAESVRLQQEGVGPGRLLGCGLFLPHKGIDPVSQPSN
jgi:CRISPR-associated protein Cas6